METRTSPCRLYRATSTAPRFPYRGATYRNVKITWWAARDEPPVPYQEAIVQYDQVAPDWRTYAQGCIDELFTLKEANALRDYLWEKHRVRTIIEEVPLPMVCDTLPMGACPAGGGPDHYMLDHEDDYNLTFPVWGYFDVRHAQFQTNLLRRLIRWIMAKTKPAEWPCGVDESGIPF